MCMVFNENREFCDVFIGVYVGGIGVNGEGVQVINIIGGILVEEYGVQFGDIILVMDGVKVKGNVELFKECNKYEFGDEFMFIINWGGMIKDLGVKFYICECVEEEVFVIVEEVMDMLESILELASYWVFLNLSYGLIWVQFIVEEVLVSV